MSEQRPDRQGNRKNGSGGSGNGGRQPNGANSGLRFGRGLFGWVLFIALAVMLFMLLNKGSTQYASIPFSEFWTRLDQDRVKTLTIETDKILGEFRSEETIQVGEKADKVGKFQTALPAGANNTWDLMRDVLERRKGAEVKVENSPNWLLQVIIPLIPWLLIFGFIWFFVFRQLRNSAGAGGMLGNFGRSRHKITSKEHTNVTFEDVAGVEEAKDEVMEIVEFLKNPKKFQRLGGRIPRGVLLVGEPGTGKTLLAKAIAGEADVPFFSISGSDFVEMFVGVGASRVRDLFKQAKDNSPCIIFLDEIDAVGRRRGSGFSSGGHDEREQTLNAILVEMDGFDTNDQVIVCAATNRVDVLDPALTRPGRFDRQIYVPLPDVKGRMDILKVHSRKVKLGPNVDLLRLARATPGFSAPTSPPSSTKPPLARRWRTRSTSSRTTSKRRATRSAGAARKSRVIDEKEKLATAYHEAGHAVVQYLEKDADPVHKVTIIPRGNFGGATFALPEKDRTNYSRKWCIAQMKVAFAGRIAEEMFTGDVNTGVMGDIRQATSIARRMIREWGMNDRVGFVYYGDDDSRPNFMGGFGEGKEYSEETARIIDEEIKKLIDTLFEETRKILEANRERVDALAKALLKYETLDSQDVDRIMRGDNLTRPTVSDLLEREQSRGRGAVIAPNENPAEPDVRLGGGPLPAPG